MRLWRRDRRTAPRLPERDLQVIWSVLSALLDYPDEALAARVPVLRAALAPAAAGGELSGAVGAGVTGPIGQYLDLLESTDLGDLQRDYVATFDVTRKHALHLTYAVHGDTRRRGVALVEFKQAYRAAGAHFADGDELPDHLCVALQFGALYSVPVAWKLLNDHRVSIELLAAALHRGESRFTPVVDALRATLPALDGDGEQALRRLVAEGPPSEDVGLDNSPYGWDPRLAPSADPRLNPRPDPAPAGLGATIPVGAPR